MPINKNSIENDSVDENLEDLALFGEMEIGESARLFIESPAGQFAIGALKQDIQANLEQLAETSAWRKRKCESLRAEIRARKYALGVLVEAITLGDLAHQNMLNKMQG